MIIKCQAQACSASSARCAISRNTIISGKTLDREGGTMWTSRQLHKKASRKGTCGALGAYQLWLMEPTSSGTPTSKLKNRPVLLSVLSAGKRSQAGEHSTQQETGPRALLVNTIQRLALAVRYMPLAAPLLGQSAVSCTGPTASGCNCQAGVASNCTGSRASRDALCPGEWPT